MSPCDSLIEKPAQLLFPTSSNNNWNLTQINTILDSSYKNFSNPKVLDQMKFTILFSFQSPPPCQVNINLFRQLKRISKINHNEFTPLPSLWWLHLSYCHIKKKLNHFTIKKIKQHTIDWFVFNECNRL